MTTSTYKGYTIVRVGLSHHVYRPGRESFDTVKNLPASQDDCLAQSMAAAKRWIDQDRQPAICSCGYRLGHPGLCQGIF
jgi:hypothetical protein